MNAEKIGLLIRRLRDESGLTQLQLARRLGVSDKAVSKWERGLGCPDVSLLPALSDVFRVDLERLLAGDLAEHGRLGGDMKRLRFHVCPVCGNLVVSMADAGVSCCGKKLDALSPRRPDGDEALSAEIVENDYFISSRHPMTREHFVSFVALVTGESVMVRKLYPEWDLQLRIPVFAHGVLLWYCTKHGLFYRNV